MNTEEYNFRELWGSSTVAPSFGIMRRIKGDRPFLYTPVYVLYDLIEAVQALPKCTREAIQPLLFTPEVDVALAALVGARRDVPHPESHFPGPEASFFRIVIEMRSRVPRP